MLAASLAELLRTYFGLGQLASEVVASLIVFGLAIFVGWIAYSAFRRYLTRWARGTKTKIDDEILRNIKAPVILFAILFALTLAFVIYHGLLRER